jgi:HTH-type transcriptional regulator / antitoxin HigA
MEPIKNNSQYYIALAKIESFIDKGFDYLDAEETKELAILSEKVELYETKKFPMPIKTSIVNLLESIMQEKRLNQSEFSRMLEISGSMLSEILHGKKKINLKIARKIHSKLHIDGNVILESD